MNSAREALTAALADRYRVERELGAGGMATVHLAHDLKHDRSVAIKVLRPELAASLGAERFLSEIKTTARLQHPHIVALFDSEALGGFLYYVMPYVEGESLRSRLDRDGRLDVDAMLAIIRPVSDALAYAHSLGVIHRDVKPENILRSRGQALVTDFGIARAVHAAGGARLTSTGLAIGTPMYMSPEQALGEPDVDARSDVYSLACVIYEMLAGVPPFSGPTAQAQLAQRLTYSPPRLENVPAQVDAVVQCALANAPADRFATTSALTEALGQAARRSAHLDASIVVLPFENLSPDPENAFFADGLTEEIIADLSQVRALRVISRTTAMLFRDSKKDVPTIARELDVRYVLEGSVRRAGNHLRITAQLIDAESDRHLWAEKYGGTLDDVFDLQEQLSRRIVDGLKLTLTPEESTRLSARPIADVRAYDAYLRANAAIGRLTESGMHDAIRDLQTARGIIGDNALLFCGMSYAHWFLANIGIGIEENIDRCGDWARKALALDPHSAKARALLGMSEIIYRGRKPRPEAIAHLKQALGDDPNEPLALLGLTIVCLYAGRTVEARAFVERHARREPLDVWTYALPIYIAWFEGDFAQGLAASERAIAALGELTANFLHMAWSLAWLGRHEEALSWVGRMAAAAPGHVHTKLALMLKHGLAHDIAGARAELTPEFHDWCYREVSWSNFVAAAFALAGAADDALAWLEHSVDLGFINYPFLAERDPFMNGLRGTSRFAQLMERVRSEHAAFEV